MPKAHALIYICWERTFSMNQNVCSFVCQFVRNVIRFNKINIFILQLFFWKMYLSCNNWFLRSSFTILKIITEQGSLKSQKSHTLTKTRKCAMKPSERASISKSRWQTVKNVQIDSQTMEIWTKKVNVPWVSESVTSMWL